MKAILAILLASFAVSLSDSSGQLVNGTLVNGTLVNASPARVYLLKEGFEGTGYENAGWTETGTPNEDYTATVLEGSQSLNIVATLADVSTVYTHTTSGEIWVYFLLRVNSLTTACFLYQVQDISGNNKVIYYMDATGHLQVSDYAVYNPKATVNAVSTGTTYHVWIHYLIGTGANGVADIGFSTTGVRPTSGNNFAAQTDCGFTANANRANLGNSSASFSCDYIIDKFRVDNVLIGDNPE